MAEYTTVWVTGWLALAEMEVALQVLLTSLPAMRPVTAGIRRNHRANLRGVSALPVEW